jgi:glycosyltransferase involved in cell wall biosynthesis
MSSGRRPHTPDGRPLRILAYTDSAGVGGAELALGYLLGALAGEIEVGVLTTSPEVGEAVAAHRSETRLTIVRRPAGSGDRGALLAHVRAIRAYAPHVVHAQQAWPWACGYGEVAALLTPGVRVVAVDQLPVGGAVPRRRILARRVLERRLHAHVAVGERAAREVERIVGLRHGSVGSVPNGVPPDGDDGDTPALAPSPVIGSLGRLTEQKGYDLLIRALADLPGATLVLVGDGPERGSLQALAAQLGVSGRLVITGWKADARRCLPAFDVFALPSRWEGMPLGILEAMHAGLPVVAGDVGSVAEAVRDGDTGYVVAPDDLAGLTDRLRRLLDDRTLRRSMGERGRVVAGEEFTAVAMARRYERIYERVLAGRRRGLSAAPQGSSRSAW